MRTPTTLALAAGFLACPIQAPAGSIGEAVSVEVRLDDGRALELYPASGRNRAYAEAVRGAGYRLVLHNRTSRRVGLCIAVDGRNIISGAKSWLGGGERLYILEPHATQEYAGWRTGRDTINRFFFTTAENSYAGSFDDTSAMGVVAVAVYAEAAPPPSVAGPVPGAPRMEKQRAALDCESAAGTGYGAREHSPSLAVSFRPEPQALERTFIKYEWRETLRRLGVIRDVPPANRFWNEGFAPPPRPRG